MLFEHVLPSLDVTIRKTIRPYEALISIVISRLFSGSDRFVGKEPSEYLEFHRRNTHSRYIMRNLCVFFE
jgi:hypothetical protein